jgi:hypothetical protein
MIESVSRENRTRRLGYRLVQLEALHKLLAENTAEILDALKSDEPQDQFHLSHLQAIMRLVAERSVYLYGKFQKRDTQKLDTVLTSSVLVIGSENGTSSLTLFATIHD